MPKADSRSKEVCTDALGQEIKVGSAVAYASAEGQAPCMKFAVVSREPKYKPEHRDPRRRWAVQIQPIYSPGRYGSGKVKDEKARKQSLSMPNKIVVLSMTAEELREHVRIIDAKQRLDHDPRKRQHILSVSG